MSLELICAIFFLTHPGDDDSSIVHNYDKEDADEDDEC